MYKLRALKCCVVRIYAILSIALMVPLTQQSVFHSLKCRVLGFLFIAAAATRASTIVHSPHCYLSLPLMSAVWTLPVSSGVAASKCLLRCLGILAVIPISCLLGCFGGKRIVLAHLSALTVWAVSAVRPACHCCQPGMKAACWTVGT